MGPKRIHFTMFHPTKNVKFSSCPREAKGLLLASIRDPNPVVFFEPKVEFKYSSSITAASEYLLCFAETKTTSPVFLSWLYHLAVDEVPEEDYMLPLS